MLGKLLKYDLRYTFRYWWILALSSIGLSVVGGVCFSIISNDTISENFPLFTIFAGLGILLTVVGLSAFLICSGIFVYVRFYKNFFSDEGYLTFTLPAKRNQLLLSKLIMQSLTALATLAVLAFDIVTMIAIASRDSFFKLDSWKAFLEALSDFFSMLGAFAPVYIVEAILFLIIASLFSSLMLFACITFASTITKKNKVFAAVGIYYLVNAVLSFVIQVIVILGMIGLVHWVGNLPEGAAPGMMALIMFVPTALCAAATLLLYTFELYLLDRKLNLA